MNDMFDLTNILLLAVAVLIFFRLRSVLGRRTGSERPQLDPFAAEVGQTRERDNVIPLPRSAPQTPASAKPSLTIDDRVGSASLDAKAREPLRDIAAADPTFETAGFLKGARAAYEMIVTAYAKGDRDTLGNLLSHEVYDSFNGVINEREEREETTEFSFVGIVSADIADANLAERAAHVTVKFVSQLVTAVRDKEGAVVEGDVKEVRQLTDVWTFMRDLGSKDPNWRVVATDTP